MVGPRYSLLEYVLLDRIQMRKFNADKGEEVVPNTSTLTAPQTASAKMTLPADDVHRGGLQFNCVRGKTPQTPSKCRARGRG